MLLLFTFMGCFGVLWGLCPPAEYIYPACTCKDMTLGSMIMCSNIYSIEDLITPIRSLAGSKFQSFSLEINNSSLRYIPHDIFKGTKFEKIRFLNTQIMSLSDSDFAFEGLEDTLTEIRATDAHYVASWDWNQLKNLHKLHLVDVNWISMESVSEPFPELKALTAVGITRAEISYIVDYAFAKLTKLRILNLKQNSIDHMTRNMLPHPAEELIVLDLSENQLQSLPVDFFTAMPELDILSLQNNKFLSLPENVFSLPFTKIDSFHVYDNPIRCDCRLSWIRDSRTPYTFEGQCAEPKQLAGKDIFRLEYRDLLC